VSVRDRKINQQIGAAIRHRRCQLGWSQSALGEALGVTFQMVQKYESGKTAITFARVLEIADVLGLSISRLAAVTGKPEGTAEPDRLLLEHAKRFAKLKPHERQGVALLVQKLTEAA
jgi:transcriptional regulator with XRE-family HTH domain